MGTPLTPRVSLPQSDLCTAPPAPHQNLTPSQHSRPLRPGQGPNPGYSEELTCSC